MMKRVLRGFFYSIDEGKLYNFSRGKINLSNLKDGDHKITFYAIDNVNNKEEVHSYNFYLDKIAPEANFKIIGDSYVNNSKQTVRFCEIKS